MPPHYHDSSDPPSRFLSPAADPSYQFHHHHQHLQQHHQQHHRPSPPPHPHYYGPGRPPPPRPAGSPHARTRATPSPTPSPLPRTSSLLPPPNLVPQPQSRQAQQSARVPIDFDASGLRQNALANPVSGATNTQHHQHHHHLLPRRSHSRSSSAGPGPSNEPSSRLLDRWSASSTSSSKNSSAHRRSARSAHRLSVDAGTWLEHSNQQPSIDHSPRKLRKNPRRSASIDAAALLAQDTGSRSSRPATRDNNPVVHIGLPPLETFSSLQDSIRQDFAPLRSAWNNSPAEPSNLAPAPPPPPQDPLPEQPPTPQGFQFSDPAPQPSGSSMPYERAAEAYVARGHSRNRSQNAKGSADSSSSKARDRGGKPPSQKAMLSRALQRANTAVQLDNAQNYEGARQSYAEACDLLAQVLVRTSTEEDKRKLEAIRQTYTSRIDELDQMGSLRAGGDKALPARPESLGLQPGPVISVEDDENDEPAIIETATLTRITRNDGRGTPRLGMDQYEAQSHSYAAPRRGNSNNDLGHGLPHNAYKQHPLQSSFSRSREHLVEDHLIFQRPADEQYMPPPLSPRRPPSPPKADARMSPEGPVRSDFSMPSQRNESAQGHARAPSRESNSWLDPIDESCSSSGSSIHSRTSSFNLRRKHIRAASGATEAEFDAALDAAVEAAYDDGYEPMDHGYGVARADSPIEEDVVARAMHRVQLAKERVRETEREVFEENQKARLRKDSATMVADFYDEGSSEDEERMLEEMTRSLAGEDFGRAPSRTLPRESDSSGFTSRTWHSSQGSNPPTTATTLATVVEPMASLSKVSEPPAPPPSHALPQIPPKPGMAAPRTQSPAGSQSVRARRLSGQNPKQLKIETGKLQGRFGATSQLSQIPADEEGDRDTFDMNQGTERRTNKRRSADSTVSPTTTQPPMSTQSPAPDSAAAEDASDSRTSSPAVFPPVLRKKYSSSSLRSRNMSISNLDETSDLSPGTPLSNGFSGNGRLPAIPPLPTPLAAAFGSKGGAAGGLHLFDDTFHAPNSPGSPNSLLSDAPASLEPCPNDDMLRPFWLMRCLYQTLVHPRGGYLSNKLFVPREVWKVKGVKLRNIDDKISTCDYLTAALLKLAKVDNCDADAVLEEMQSLEGILEQVQSTLTRKLGVEVGVQGSGTLFKDASNPSEADAAVNVPRSASISGKSSFSWRRLRSKNSGAGLSSAYNLKNSSLAESGKESPTVDTLPMTANPTSRPTKRDVISASFTGPNAHYMGSLARLFDAAQTIDQIARQVEDPGLRHADKTQVGLELCTRHAAEFFGFYICRFVLSDVSILLDKFIKRSTEWVVT